MKTFVILFKTGQRVAVKAEKWNREASGYFTFQTSNTQPSKDIYINPVEVLYVVAEDVLVETPLGK